MSYQNFMEKYVCLLSKTFFWEKFISFYFVINDYDKKLVSVENLIIEVSYDNCKNHSSNNIIIIICYEYLYTFSEAMMNNKSRNESVNNVIPLFIFSIAQE